MSFDELIIVLKGLDGRMVEATVRTPYDDPESGSGGYWFASFSEVAGELGSVEVSGHDHRTLYWRREVPRTRPHEGSLTFWRDGFERAEVRGSGRSLEEVVAEERFPMDGATWEIDVFQRGLLIEMTIYVS